MNKSKIMIVFPGGNYGVDSPLFYYARLKFISKGYEVKVCDYNDYIKRANSFEECIEEIKKKALTQMRELNIESYNNVVFVSKSIGTVVAGYVEERLALTLKQIYLTPLKESLPYMKGLNNDTLVIAGASDNQLDINILYTHCNKYNINLKVYENAGHRLEVPNDINRDIQILQEIVTLY